MLMPFKIIDYEREFRVIIINKQIKCISQQKWYKNLTWSPGENVVHSIIQLWEFDLKNKLQYNDVVLDVFID